MRAWLDDYIADATTAEREAREVHTHPMANRKEEPNARSVDRALRRRADVRLDNGQLTLHSQRTHAWEYYDVIEAEPCDED